MTFRRVHLRRCPLVGTAKAPLVGQLSNPEWVQNVSKLFKGDWRPLGGRRGCELPGDDLDGLAEFVAYVLAGTCCVESHYSAQLIGTAFEIGESVLQAGWAY